MNGLLPIAGIAKPGANVWRAGVAPPPQPNAASRAGQPNRKFQLLQLCARIGYTPHLCQSIKPIPFMIQGRRLLTCLQRFPTT